MKRVRVQCSSHLIPPHPSFPPSLPRAMWWMVTAMAVLALGDTILLDGGVGKIGWTAMGACTVTTDSGRVEVTLDSAMLDTRAHTSMCANMHVCVRANMHAHVRKIDQFFLFLLRRP